MQLHVRWFHATPEEMKRTLKAANVPARAVGEVSDLLSQCSICRDWRKPGPNAITSVRITTKFNEEVQFDFLFYTSLIEPTRGLMPICHLIDTCIRWSATAVSRSKEETDLLNCISTIWIAIFGPPEVLTSDLESAMKGQAAMDWAQETSSLHWIFKRRED